MNKPYNFTEIEYKHRRKKTRREIFLEKMDTVVPWDNWISVIKPIYPNAKRGRPPIGIEKMLRMMLLQIWFNLSDERVEDEIYDSYAMRCFMKIDFTKEQAPDATTLCNFRKLLMDNGIYDKLFLEVEKVLEKENKFVRGGTIVDATIVEASSSKKK